MKILRMFKVLLPILSLTMGTLCWAGSAETFHGEATVASATVLGIGATIGDTGALPSKGGALQTNLATMALPQSDIDPRHSARACRTRPSGRGSANLP